MCGDAFMVPTKWPIEEPHVKKEQQKSHREKKGNG